MTQRFSLAADGGRMLSENFAVREFACKDGSDTVLIDPELVKALQKLRSHFGRPVRITSAYRTPAHNKAVGGSPASQHLCGRAADIQINGVNIAEAARYADALLGESGGLGLYPPKAGRARGWLHIDVRRRKTRWEM